MTPALRTPPLARCCTSNIDKNETQIVMMKHVSEIFEEWLDWPGSPFAWRACDSPIENEMFRELHKFASDQVALSDQHEIKTDTGSFRLDFLLRHRTTGRQIAIECDGKDFHSVTRDSKRDTAIIRTGLVAAIYRVRGKDCHHCSLDVWQLIAQKEPWIFCDGFHEIATFRPHPTTYQDDSLEGTQDGYKGFMRTYFDVLENDDERHIECWCDGECGCSYTPEVAESITRTPTVIRYMSTSGHPSAFERPERPISLPMPVWKADIAKYIRRSQSFLFP
jgi:hypothetical protein